MADRFISLRTADFYAGAVLTIGSTQVTMSWDELHDLAIKAGQFSELNQDGAQGKAVKL